MARYGFGQTITVITTTLDRYGDPSAPVETTVDDVVIYPTSKTGTPSNELSGQQDEDIVTNENTLLLPVGAVLPVTARVRLPGESKNPNDPWLGALWAVDGDTGPGYVSPHTGWTPGTICKIRKVV